MNRRSFLKSLLAVPVVAAVPALAIAVDEYTNVLTLGTFEKGEHIYYQDGGLTNTTMFDRMLTKDEIKILS